MAVEPDLLRPVIRCAIRCGLDDSAVRRHPARGSTGISWIEATSDNLPGQGWKLHVSASVANAAATIEAAVPLLFAAGASFKLVGSLAELARLNRGRHGRSQVGKFLTVYPRGDREAVELAAALHEATLGLGGPEVPSDLPYRQPGAVWRRYGAFSSAWLQRRDGAIVPAYRAPSGAWVEDRRTRAAALPEGVADPFPDPGDLARPERNFGLLNRRYLLTGVIHRSDRGDTWMGVDLANATTCIVKSDEDADDGHLGAAREAEILRALADVPGTPRCIDQVREGERGWIVLSDEGRDTIQSRLERAAESGARVPLPDALRWMGDLCAIAARMHARGIVHGDIKPGNIVIREDGRAVLIDFSTASEAGNRQPLAAATPGYVTPGRLAGERASIRDDLRGLAAVMYALVTGLEPSRAPDPACLLRQDPLLLQPACPAPVAAVLRRALAADGPASAACLGREISSVAGSDYRDPPWGDIEPEANTGYDLAAMLAAGAARLRETAGMHDGTGAPFWWLHRDGEAGPPVRDLDNGAAGVLLALALLEERLGQACSRGLIVRAAHGLLAMEPLPGGPLPGLFVGESGIAIACMRAGLTTSDPELVARASACLLASASLPAGSPDLYIGDAGRLMAHDWAHAVTGDPGHWQAACAIAGRLMDSAIEDGAGRRWRTASGDDPGRGEFQFGYAHGAAGIADALLGHWRRGGSARCREAAASTARWIEAHAVELPGGIAGWPVAEGGRPAPPMWCHGAAGIGRFLARAARSGITLARPELPAMTAMAAARYFRNSGPGCCHGLAGNILFLDTLPDSAAKQEAASLRAVLATAIGPDPAAWTGEPGYWNGLAGALTALGATRAPWPGST